jgi:hypothetical protein
MISLQHEFTWTYVQLNNNNHDEFQIIYFRANHAKRLSLAHTVVVPRRYDKVSGLNEQGLGKDPFCSPLVYRINTTGQMKNCMFKLYGSS